MGRGARQRCRRRINRRSRCSIKPQSTLATAMRTPPRDGSSGIPWFLCGAARSRLERSNGERTSFRRPRWPAWPAARAVERTEHQGPGPLLKHLGGDAENVAGQAEIAAAGSAEERRLGSQSGQILFLCARRGLPCRPSPERAARESRFRPNCTYPSGTRDARPGGCGTRASGR